MKFKIETSSTVILGERKGEIEIGKSKINTPSPMITNTDINYANKITRNSGIDIFYKNEILEIRDLLFPDKVKKLIMDKRGQKSRSDWINRQISNAKSSSDVSFTLYTPTFAGVTIEKKLVDEIVKMQMNTDLTAVNIPDPTWMSNEESVEIIREKSKLITKIGKEPFYLIPMSQDYERFSQKIKMSEQYITGLTAIYSDIASYAPNFKILAGLRSNPKILRILSNVEKTYSATDSMAFYPLSLFVSDAFSLKYGGFGGNERDADKERYTARILDLETFEYLTVQKHKERYKESLNSGSPVFGGKEMGEILADFYGNLTEAFRIDESFKIYDYYQTLLSSFQVGKTFEFITFDKRLTSLLHDTYLSDSMKKQTMLPVSGGSDKQ
jgi:hypothetical protein